MTIKQEILTEFQRIGCVDVLAREDRYYPGTFEALSQYGYCLMDNFKTLEEAEDYTVYFYSSRMNLIRQ